MNKHAGAMSIIIWIGSIFIIIIFLAGWVYFHHLMTSTMQSINIDTNIVNFSNAVNKVIVPIDNAVNSLQWISFILIVMLAFAILIENYYIREHPVFFFVHIIIVVIAIVASTYVSNNYSNLMQSGVLSSTLIGFKASSYIMLYLPLWVAVIGIFGIILLVINATRDPEIRVKGRGI
jgi:phosphoglycerol transferase MdoB-like AlkP superfamily enzyme